MPTVGSVKIVMLIVRLCQLLG